MEGFRFPGNMGSQYGSGHNQQQLTFTGSGAGSSSTGTGLPVPVCMPPYMHQSTTPSMFGTQPPLGMMTPAMSVYNRQTALASTATRRISPFVVGGGNTTAMMPFSAGSQTISRMQMQMQMQMPPSLSASDQQAQQRGLQLYNQQRIAYLSSEVERLTSDWHAACMTNSQWQSDYETLQQSSSANLSYWQQLFSDNVALKQTLEAEIQTLKDELKQARDSLKEASDTNIALHDNLKDKEQRVTDLTTTLSEKEAECTRLAEDIQSNKDQIDDLHRQHLEQNRKAEELGRQLKVSVAQIETLEQERKSVSEVFQAQVEQIKASLQEQISATEAAETRITELDQQLKDLTTSREEIQRLNATLKDELAQLKQQLESTETLNKKLRGETDTVRRNQAEKILEQDREQQQLRSSLKAAEGLNASLQQKVDALENSLKTEKDQHHLTLQGKSNEISGLQTRADLLDEEVTGLRDTLRTTSNTYKSLQAELQRAHNKITEKDAKLESMATEHDSALTSLQTSSTATREALQQEIEQLKEQLEEQRQQLERFEWERQATPPPADLHSAITDEPTLSPGTADSQIETYTEDGTSSTVVEHSEEPTSTEQTIVELPRNIQQVFENADALGIPDHYVYLGHSLRKRKGQVPEKITRMKELIPTQYINLELLDEIAQQFDGADGEMKTPLQNLGTEHVWSQACHFELFMFVLGLGHWMGLPHAEVCKKLNAIQNALEPSGKGKAKRHPDFNASELKALKAWARDKPHYEKNSGTPPFWPIEWLTTLATELRKNPEDKLTRLAACWADFSIQASLEKRSDEEKQAYQNNPDPFNWRRLGEETETGVTGADSAGQGPSGLNTQPTVPDQRRQNKRRLHSDSSDDSSFDSRPPSTKKGRSSRRIT